MAQKKTRGTRPAKNWNPKMVMAPQAQAMLPTKPTGKINWGDIDVAQIDKSYAAVGHRK